jgi:hypothetical protein
MLARFACWWTRLCYLSVEGDQANVPTETCVCGETEDWLADCFVLLQLTVRASVRMSGGSAELAGPFRLQNVQM